jgi:hypothetical protein
MLLSDHREHRKNVRLISRTKIASVGAGQIIVDKGTAYIAHLCDEGVTLVDVRNPYAPKVLSKIGAPLKGHSHKVQVSGNIMIVNNERYKQYQPWVAGVRIYDVSSRDNPTEIGFFETKGKGVHRMWFVDGQFAHITATAEGYTDQIYMVLDLSDPRNPQEYSRWWMPGMWHGGGEQPSWPDGVRVRAHGPAYVCGNRVYLGWTDGGFTILDITDLKNPQLIAKFNCCPPFGGLTHTVLPLPQRELLVVSDEAHADLCDEPEKYVWLFDVRNERNPIPVSTVQVEDRGFCEKGGRFGPHNVHENRPGSLIDDQLIYIAYFNGGLRIVDIANKYRPEEVGYFIPECPAGQKAVQTNDVFVDSDGLIYIVDRLDGTMYVLEYTGPR